MESMDKGDYDFSGNVAEKWKHLIKLNQVYGRAYYTQDNDVELYTDGNLMFEAVLQDIKNAETSINAEYYILKRDHIGRRFIQALTEKAKEGVEVRLLLDAMGSRYITKSVPDCFESQYKRVITIMKKINRMSQNHQKNSQTAGQHRHSFFHSLFPSPFFSQFQCPLSSNIET